LEGAGKTANPENKVGDISKANNHTPPKAGIELNLSEKGFG
jgi:hypothetical protein